jgi:hypothetical protein
MGAQISTGQRSKDYREYLKESNKAIKEYSIGLLANKNERKSGAR